MRAQRPTRSPSASRIVRRTVSAGIAAALVSVTVSCGLFTDERQETLEAFAEAVNAGDVTTAAELTTDPEAAARALQASLDGMAGAARTMSISAGEGADSPAQTITVWDLGEQRLAETVGIANVAETEAGFRIQWAPEVLDTRLNEGGRLVYADLLDYDTPIVDRNESPLMTWQTVTVISLESGAEDSAAAVAALVSDAAPTITAASIQEGMAEAPDQDYVVVTLREDDIAPIRTQLSEIDGVQLSEQGRLLTADRSLTSPALRGLPEVWEEALRAEQGWVVTASNPESTERVAGRDAGEVANIPTMLDLELQQAAQEAVDGEERPAMLVAIQPSTGGILAVAQNSAADSEGPVSLTGMYAPGSTFKIVTTSAALNAGITSADEVMPCPGVATIEGRTIPNDEGFDLGQVPLHTAFARSCNTTQGMLAVQLDASALTDTAQALGLGADFDIPGLTTVTGNVPVTEAGPARVEAAIGQGEVLASPFGMAVAVASLANNGTMVTPSLVEEAETTADVAPQPLPEEVVAAIRQMMRETVSSGTATALADISGLGGKTGTAEVGGGPSNGWFVGIADDIAFATFVEGADSSAPAVAVSGRFLRAVTP
ncbi:penicillin-binding transpeptidase domain-containing protein [Hoyosella sp. YIM 151337]|uniref:penicillin-binding transpeptidase domain-containing protein n=1 Tax=Hoyosella sp. YIM 151337 TaxID=2992742 RepID=UPI0022354E2C|nr:penicillin-binding transpeptidase domain-containing protein [Hoyosella sp. YIM 151337]MCW4354862.1 penicillin-binding transpeptidase domain-containing protein [Hoyosella sp. YIM 151337]